MSFVRVSCVQKNCIYNDLSQCTADYINITTTRACTTFKNGFTQTKGENYP